VLTRAYPSSTPEPGFGFRSADFFAVTFFAGALFAGDIPDLGRGVFGFTVDDAGMDPTVPKRSRRDVEADLVE